MRAADIARLVALSAIWGASFMFMRIAAPAIGPVWTSTSRVLLGGLVLLVWFRMTGFDPELRRHARVYLMIGAVNSAIPFTLYAFASIHLPAAFLATLNATAPAFGLVFGALAGLEQVNARRIAGLLLGGLGVALLAGAGDAAAGPASGSMAGWAIAASLAACAGYGITGVLIKKYARDASPRGIAVGAQLGAAVLLLPLLPLQLPSALPGPAVIASILGLALLASAVALVMYFRLIANVGAARALTVTYLIPVFGALWGWMFLGEALPADLFAGGAAIIAGTLLVTRG